MSKHGTYVGCGVIFIIAMIIFFYVVFGDNKKGSKEHLCLCGGTALARKYKREVDNSKIPAFEQDRNGFDCV